MPPMASCYSRLQKKSDPCLSGWHRLVEVSWFRVRAHPLLGSSCTRRIVPRRANLSQPDRHGQIDAEGRIVVISIARPESPRSPPMRQLALTSIAVAGPSAPCSIAPCRCTSPPGSNSPATADKALPAQPMSNESSVGISNAGFSRMALPALNAPSAATIFSSPTRAKVAQAATFAATEGALGVNKQDASWGLNVAQPEAHQRTTTPLLR